ncbi:MAG: SHOCT domain-containing protein [Clostridia bacterium]|nr:SHOCT domain-containing protein [Clostridia bacterium]
MEGVIFIFIGICVVLGYLWNSFDEKKKEKLEENNDIFLKGVLDYSKEECISEFDEIIEKLSNTKVTREIKKAIFERLLENCNTEQLSYLVEFYNDKAILDDFIISEFDDKILKILKDNKLNINIGKAALDRQKEYELNINNFEYLKTRSNYKKIFLDYTNKEMSIISDGCKKLDIYKFENIIGCEREIESKTKGNSSTTTDGGIGRAVIGGIVAGGAGAIVGATTANKTTETINYSEINEITLKIILNNNKNKLIELKFPYEYLDGENLLDNGTILYTKILNIIDSNKKEIINDKDNNTGNIKDRLLQIKELLAENLITQEEFEYKKKELLSKV